MRLAPTNALDQAVVEAGQPRPRPRDTTPFPPDVSLPESSRIESSVTDGVPGTGAPYNYSNRDRS